MMSTASSSAKRSSYTPGFELPSPSPVGGAMLPKFLRDLSQDLVEVTLELDDDDDDGSIVVCSVAPANDDLTSSAVAENGILRRSLSATSRSVRRTFGWLKSASSRTTASNSESAVEFTLSAREGRRMKAKLQRTRSSAQRALNGLRFISKTTAGGNDAAEQWQQVEARFESLAKDGLLARADFGECIGMGDSEEFAVGIFDALARRRRQKITKITIEELRDFWLQISDSSFDARLQIFFDMADINEDGRITMEGVQELITLSASANKLSKLKEQAEEYASLIMEELDPENFGYIELWQLEALLLQRDVYINYSGPLSTASVPWSQNPSSLKPKNLVRRLSRSLQCLALENWRRGWILLLWVVAMACLFVWKFYQYRKNRATFQVMHYCLPVAKGAAETLKLNMALILLPVCRNTLTWLRSTRARSFIPFDDNINFHKIIAFAIAIGITIHAGNHLACDFPRLVNSSPENFAPLSSDFHNKKPTYEFLLTGSEGATGILMVILIAISFTLAAHRFRRNMVRLPAPFNKLTGFNAFWYSHHLLGLVYILLIIHGSCLYLAHRWYEKTTWIYISVPLLLYVAERSLRTCRSKHYSVKMLKASVLPGNVISLIMSKPPGFKYKSGQYIFLQCPTISPFEWHPFSITSAPGDEYLSVHIRTVGDWTRELKRAIAEEDDSSVVHPARFAQMRHLDQRGQPRLFVDGPYGAPAQDYQHYDILLLVGLGIGATPFISILRDLLDRARTAEEQRDSNTETSRSDDSPNSFMSSSLTPGDKKKSQKTTNAHFYWVTREPGSFEWFKGVMDEVAEMDHKGQIELHNYLTSVYEEGDARSTLITMVQALNHAKHGVDILSGTRVRTHFARPDWKQVFTKIASKHPYSTVGVFYCGMPMLAKELKVLSHELSQKTTTRFEFHKEYF
ncbi:respiratory burst oxidase protein E-like [Pyrus ussuriensis x Pyrus communis]|uniref:Respiratory burst oxidase protein E-like n=1 Tax=Pyrus ussuriensis x Pyrus communis TaxID=2448454 RepID=A0A5N5IF22_9ROSA|nr:respiratory burst oxidase protein E-like [Pyrus ussuriensis x Pyrus communis]